MINNNYYANPNYAYGVAKPKALNSQPLSNEQIGILTAEDNSALTLKVDEKDLWRAACTHKNKQTGASTLIQNADGSYTCSICHKTINLVDATTEQVKEVVNNLLDLLQTCKTIYLDAPEDLILQYFQLIPLLEKFPSIWDRAIKNFSMYEGYNNAVAVNPMSPGYSGFAAINNLLTNPYLQQPVYNQQQYYPQGQMGVQTMNGFNSQQMPGGWTPVMNINPQGQMGAPVYQTMNGLNPQQMPNEGMNMQSGIGNPMAYSVPNMNIPNGNVVTPTAPTVNSNAAEQKPTEVVQQKAFNV